MKLNGKRFFVGIIYSLVCAVVSVDIADSSADFLNRFVYNCIAVILRGNVCSSRFKIFNRLINASVSVFQLFRFRTHCKRKKLMPKANSENRLFADNLFKLLNAFLVVVRIPGSVRKHNTVRVKL